MLPFLEAYKNLLTKSRFCCIDCITITISCLGKKEQEEDKQNIEYRLVRSTCISSRPTRSDNNFRLKVRVQCFQVAKKIEGKCYNKLQSTSQHHICGTKNSHIQIAISLISLSAQVFSLCKIHQINDDYFLRSCKAVLSCAKSTTLIK